MRSDSGPAIQVKMSHVIEAEDDGEEDRVAVHAHGAGGVGGDVAADQQVASDAVAHEDQRAEDDVPPVKRNSWTERRDGLGLLFLQFSKDRAFGDVRRMMTPAMIRTKLSRKGMRQPQARKSASGSTVESSVIMPIARTMPAGAPSCG